MNSSNKPLHEIRTKKWHKVTVYLRRGKTCWQQKSVKKKMKNRSENSRNHDCIRNVVGALERSAFGFHPFLIFLNCFQSFSIFAFFSIFLQFYTFFSFFSRFSRLHMWPFQKVVTCSIIVIKRKNWSFYPNMEPWHHFVQSDVKFKNCNGQGKFGEIRPLTVKAFFFLFFLCFQVAFFPFMRFVEIDFGVGNWKDKNSLFC